MTSITQLYDTFSKDIPTTELSASKKDEFIKTVKKLDDKGNEILFILMKLHEMKTTENAGVPYDGKPVSDEIKFDLDHIPVPLQHILLKFMALHIKSIEEDAKIDQERRNVHL
jgi:ABC-type uncharacterized transport system ATPase subunit